MIASSPQALGLLLRSARKQKGLSQTAAGKPFGLDQTTISTIENGQPGTRLDTLFRYCAALEVDIGLTPRNPQPRIASQDEW